MPKYSGREREAKLIQRANRAAAVGRLMLGELELFCFRRKWKNRLLELDTFSCLQGNWCMSYRDI